jgi:uncharacterized protein (DUF58 family)
MVRRYHLHVPGFLYVGLTLLVGLAAVNRQNNLLVWILGVMLAALLISGMVSGVMMQNLRVKRLVAGNGVVGEPLAVRYAVTNRSRLFPAFGIHLEERPVAGRAGWPRLMSPARAWVMHLGPRETVHGEAVFWPRRRGEARFGQLRIWTTFPFGIVKKSITISQPQHVLIYPMLYELRRDVLGALAPQGLSGTKISPHTGDGDDYYGMREFRPGDQLRQIAWKRTACLDQLVCLERTKPISLAASIVHAADREGFEVGLTLPGLGQPALLIRRGHWHRSKIMAALAGIDLDTARAPHGPAPATHGERAAQIVIHPHRVEPAIGRDDALHLTAGQLGSLAVRVIGWDPDEAGPEDQPREAAA